MAEMKRIDVEQLEQVVGGTIYVEPHGDPNNVIDDFIRNTLQEPGPPNSFAPEQNMGIPNNPVSPRNPGTPGIN